MVVRLLFFFNVFHQFKGSIAFICNLFDVENINLSENQFSGLIPDCFARMRGLKQFSASRNQLSGSLPQSLTSSESLQTLKLESNLLFGNVTLSGSSLSNLDLSFNNFTGVLSVKSAPSFVKAADCQFSDGTFSCLLRSWKFLTDK